MLRYIWKTALDLPLPVWEMKSHSGMVAELTQPSFLLPNDMHTHVQTET